MRILLINETDELTGGAAIIFDLQTRLLREAGYDVFTFALSKKYSRDDYNLRLPDQGKRWIRKLMKLTINPKVYKGLRTFINEISPDIIIIHNNALYPVSLLLACRGYKTVHIVHDFYLLCPTVWAVQKTNLKACPCGVRLRCINRCSINPLALIFFYAPLFFFRKVALKRIVDILIAPSSTLVTYLNHFGFRAILIRNPVPLLKKDNASRGVDRNKSSKVTKHPYLLYVGSLTENKGVDSLILAFNKVRTSFPWINLKIVGDGEQKPFLESLARQLGLVDFINFLRFVSRDDLYILYKNALAVVVPSIGQENWPTVICEAMACGCPVIGSDRGGISELLGFGERGLLFKPGDIYDLADKIKMLIQHRHLSYELARRGKSYVESVLDNKNYLHKISRLIFKITC